MAESQAAFIQREIERNGPVYVMDLEYALDCPRASVRRALHALKQRGVKVIVQNGLVDIRDTKR